MGPSVHPTNGIAIEYEIQSKFTVLWFKIYSTNHNKILYTSRQCHYCDMCKTLLWSVEYVINKSITNFHWLSNSIEVLLVGWAAGIQIVLYLTPWWSWNGNIFHVTGPLCGEFTGHRWLVTRRSDVFFDLCLNKCLSKQSWGWWFEMPSPSLWHYCNVIVPSGDIWHPKLGSTLDLVMDYALSLNFTRNNADLFLIRHTGLENTYVYVNGLMQERRNSIANTLELCLFSINPLMSFAKWWPFCPGPKVLKNTSNDTLSFHKVDYSTGRTDSNL